MGTVQIQLELPEELAHQLDPSGSNIGRRTLEFLLTRLFQDGSMSSGKAAELLGISKADFRSLLHQHRIPYLDMAEDEFLADLQAAAAAAEPHQTE